MHRHAYPLWTAKRFWPIAPPFLGNLQKHQLRRGGPLCRHRQGDRQAVRAAPGRVLPRLPRRDRPPDRSRPRDPRDLRQPLRPQGAGGPQVATGPSPVRAALHPDRPGSTRSSGGSPNYSGAASNAACSAHSTSSRPPSRTGSRSGTSRPALQVDQDRRPDHRSHLPLLRQDLRTGTLEAGARFTIRSS